MESHPAMDKGALFVTFLCFCKAVLASGGGIPPPISVEAIIDISEDPNEPVMTRSMIRHGVVQPPFDHPPGGEVFRGIVAIQCQMFLYADVSCHMTANFSLLPAATMAMPNPGDLQGMVTTTLSRETNNGTVWDINFSTRSFHHWVSENLAALGHHNHPTHATVAIQFHCRDRQLPYQTYHSEHVYVTKHFVRSTRPDTRNEYATWWAIAALFLCMVAVNCLCWLYLWRAVDLKQVPETSTTRGHTGDHQAGDPNDADPSAFIHSRLSGGPEQRVALIHSAAGGRSFDDGL